MTAAIERLCLCDRIWLVQSARHSSGALLVDPFKNQLGYRLVDWERFDQNLISNHFAVDVWLGEKEEELFGVVRQAAN
jgi:hypothetical protein